jgi:hypothetical protein
MGASWSRASVPGRDVPARACVCAQNTFTCIPDMVDTLMPWLSPLKSLLLRMDWPSKTRVSKLTMPILFVAGEAVRERECVHRLQR